jgi:hypothetical protein
MPYTVGDTIEASTFNSLSGDMNTIFGLGFGDEGYGQGSITAVVAGSTIRGAEWLELRNNLDDSISHQGTATGSAAIPPTGDFQIGDLIIAYDGSSGRWNLPATLASANTNRLNIGGGQSTVSTDTLTTFRTTSWSTQLKHIFTMTFTSNNDARHFFNSGGQFRIRASRAGGAATPQNADWTALLSAAGTFIFDASAYFNGALTSNVQRFTQVGASAYATNDWTIFEKRNAINTANGSQGRIITFEVQFNDDSGGFTDEVNGSIINRVDLRYATGAFSSSSKFNSVLGPLTTTALSAGS